MRLLASILALILLGCGAAPASTATTPTTRATEHAATEHAAIDPHIEAVVGAADRTAEDLALDAQRRPAEVFSFFGIQEGWHVADLFAGGGYSSEILVRIVGPNGSVVAQNNAFAMERFARAPMEARLARLAMPNLSSVELELDAPIPEETRGLDAAIFILSYHDSVWMGTDRAAMNRSIFAALRPGGVYGIVDHSAIEGHGAEDTQTLHRIEESVLVAEVLAAGFVLDATSDVLRHPDDARDWSASPSTAGERRGSSDRFVLRFVRP